MLTHGAAAVLNETFSGLNLWNNSKSVQKSKCHKDIRDIARYNDEIEKLALTFHFYSPKAYQFVQPILSLPAANSLSHWSSSVNCDPGLFGDVFSYNLQDKQKDDINFTYCTLIIDAMAINNNIVYHKSSGRFIGYTDYGKDLALGDPDIPATEGEALVLIMVGLRGHWKTPIGYVLCNKITSNNLTCIIRKIY